MTTSQQAHISRNVPSTSLFLRGLCVVAIVLILLSTWAGVMVFFDRNEHMYITAAVLVSQGQALYRDFAFLQMPYQPLFYAAIYQIFQLQSHYLLVGKLISCLFLALSVLLTYQIVGRWLPNFALSSGFVLLLLLHETTIRITYESSNYIMPLALALLAVWLTLRSITPQPRPVGMFLAGLISALTVGLKLYYVGILPPLLLTLTLYPPTIPLLQRLRLLGLPFVAGLAVGWLPVFGYMLNDTEQFFFNNVGFHRTNTLWWVDFYNVTSIFADKFGDGAIILFQLQTSTLLLATAFLTYRLLRSLWPLRWHQWRQQLPVELFLSGTLFLAVTGAILLPTPLQLQYFAAPLPFLVLTLAALYRALLICQQLPYRILALVLLGLVLTSSIFAVLPLSQNVLQARDTNNWVGFTFPQAATAVSTQITQVAQTDTTNSGQVATLGPLFASEANLPIHPEFATGVFLYRVGDLLTAEQRARNVGTSPETVGELLDQEPPAAILVGGGDIYTILEPPLREYIAANNYREVPLTELERFGWTLYLPPR